MKTSINSHSLHHTKQQPKEKLISTSGKLLLFAFLFCLVSMLLDNYITYYYIKIKGFGPMSEGNLTSSLNMMLFGIKHETYLYIRTYLLYILLIFGIGIYVKFLRFLSIFLLFVAAFESLSGFFSWLFW